MTSPYPVLLALAVTLLGPGSLPAQDVTQSLYFPRDAFGAGSVSSLGTCNVGEEVVTEDMIFREAASGGILHTETHVIPPTVCNISVLQDGMDLQTGFLEILVTGSQGFQVISSLLLQLSVGGTAIDEVRINPEEPSLGFTVNFSETPDSRNGFAIMDAGDTGFTCSTVYRDGTLFGSPLQGSVVQAGPDQGRAIFFDEVFPGLPDAFGWARFDCDNPVVAMTLGQNTASGNLSVGRTFPLAGD